MKIGVVIPCYKVSRHIKDVILGLPAQAAHVIVVDDACPEGSGDVALQSGRDGLEVIAHDNNTGVGGAVLSGYRRAMELGCDIIVKMDGDGQMDPARFEEIIHPLASGSADYAKGNRFRDFEKLKSMPKARLFGNSFLSFMVKAASGYWNIVDTTNGYTAITASTVEKLSLEKISKGYFFETDMLINLYHVEAVVADVPIPAQYGDEKSSLSLWNAATGFPFKLFKAFVKRVVLRYFVYDFNMASVYMILGLPMMVFSLVLGISEWMDSILSGIPRSAGTIMLVALPMIVSFQMLVQAVAIDINSVPQRNK